MAKRIVVLALLVFFSVGLFVSTATAQTSMQRRAAEQAEAEAANEPADEADTQQAQQVQQAQPPQQTQQTYPNEPEVIRDEGARIFVPYTVHKPGLRLDMGFGDGIDRVRFGVGVGYMYAMGWEITVFDEVVAVLRAGLGPDFTLLVDNEGFNGVAGFATGRVHAVGTGVGGLGVEVAGGAGLGSGGFAPAARLGVYYSGRYAEIGYFYQFVPIFRTSWMPPHNIGIRFHIPVLRSY